MDPWRLEIIVVRDGSYGGGERRTLSRDVERGLLVRLRRGAYVERTAFEGMTVEQQHVVRLRALDAVAPAPFVYSHWSAAVLHGLPVLRARLLQVHTTVDERRQRGQDGVVAHLFAIADAEVVTIGGLVVTDVGRTVVDLAGASPMEEGVMAADGALHRGVPRSVLEEAADKVGPRRAGRRIRDVLAFADAGAESAAESRSRVTMFRIGVEPPLLQHRLLLPDGSEVFLDFLFPTVMVGGEADGDEKYLNPAFAREGAGRAVVAEKRREDMARAQLQGLGRWGWIQSGSAALLRTVLARVGVLASRPRATLDDYAARAREGRARFVPRRPLGRR